MSQVREPAFDRAVALVLRVGAFGCFSIMLAGLMVGFFVPGRIPQEIERAGVLLHGQGRLGNGGTAGTISLGTMESPVTEGAPFDGRGYVVRRRGTPEEAAGLVTYLASPVATWITGQTYALNGGYTFSL